MFETPILFLIFNRPDTTAKVFYSIRRVQPKYLYIVADGPRKEKAGEFELCEQTRAIIQSIDWPCELKTIFRTENLGCGEGPSQAISWFFNQVEQGIVLEDDCLPNQSFFIFMEEMLNKYKNNEQIMLVSGANCLLGLINIEDSYYFSQIPTTWGWATWRRAWKHLNIEMKGYEEKVKRFPEVKSIWLPHWKDIINGRGVRDAWDFQWYFSIYEQNGLSIHPKENLIKNIGFDEGSATHTFKAPWWYKFVVSKELKTTQHPQKIIVNKKADEFVKHIFLNKKPTWIQRIRLKLRSFGNLPVDK